MLLLAALPGAFAQTPAAATPPATVAALYAGEWDDIGPQYLLVPKAPRAARFAAWAQADLSSSDNATFSEVSPRSSTLTSLQAGLEARLMGSTLAGGKLTIDGGLRGQLFRYGLLDDASKVIDFLQVDRNNFDLVGSHARAVWQRGSWLAESTLQGSLMRNRRASRTFYRDLGWSISLYHQWKLAGRSTLSLGMELGRRWTWTDSYGLLPSSWNDRLEASLAAIWTRPLRPGLSWRITARAHHALYTRSDRHRSDITGTLGTELGWTLRENLELRFYVAHERRDSTELAMPDYSRWDAGSGAGLRWSF
jgi:hypothetical protein